MTLSPISTQHTKHLSNTACKMESVVLGSRVSGTGHGSRYHFQLKKQFQPDADAKWIQLSQLDAEQREAVVHFLAADRELVVPSSLKQSVDKVRHMSRAPSPSPLSPDAREPYSDQESDQERGRGSVEDLDSQSSYESDGLQDEVAQSEVYIKSPDSVPLVSPPPKTVLAGAGDLTSSLFDAAYMYSAIPTASSNLLKPSNSNSDNSNNGNNINHTNHAMNRNNITSQTSRSTHPDHPNTTAAQWWRPTATLLSPQSTVSSLPSPFPSPSSASGNISTPSPILTNPVSIMMDTTTGAPPRGTSAVPSSSLGLSTCCSLPAMAYLGTPQTPTLMMSEEYSNNHNKNNSNNRNNNTETPQSPTGRSSIPVSAPQGTPSFMTLQDMTTATTTTTTTLTPSRLTPYPGPAGTLKYLKDLNKKKKGEKPANPANPFFPQ